MHKTLRKLPSLDFLKGFEAAGRLLSFTRAAEELFLTQSALSRQMQALEEALGVAAVRAPPSRARADACRRDVPSRGHRRHCAALAAAAERARAGGRASPGLTLTTTVVVRVAVDHSAAAGVSRAASGGRGLRVRQRPHRRSRARRRRPRDPLSARRRRRRAKAVRLFGERMLPVASPAVAHDPRTPLERPADLAHHVLLHLDDPEGRTPWLDWRAWLSANGEPALKPAGSLRFTLYDQVIQAAVGGQGVALGRLPMIASTVARWPARRAVSEEVRFRARLLRDGRAACRGTAPTCAPLSSGCARKRPRRPRRSPRPRCAVRRRACPGPAGARTKSAAAARG